MFNLIKYRRLIHKNRNTRYVNLFKLIHQNQCRSILEIGVYNGVHAMQMILSASVNNPAETIHYYGFDLFEDLSETKLKDEYAKRPLPYAAIERKLKESGAEINLYKGNSKETLPKNIADIGRVDLAFIDGGHSLETIKSDWNNVQKIMDEKTIVLFDDYFICDNEELKMVCCNQLIDELDRSQYTVEFLEPCDSINKEWGELIIKMVLVKKLAQN
ncbi:MAG: class I SAM-dependent methyltransferase [Arenicellales bacterium]